MGRSEGALARWWSRADPTRPAVRADHRDGSFPRFLYRFGVLPVGLPVAVLLDLTLFAWAGDSALFFSAEHAIRLQVVILGVGVPAGLLAGRILWRLGERRAADEQLTRAFDFDATPASDAPGVE